MDYLYVTITPSYQDHFLVHHLYVEKGLSIRQIADQIFWSKETVRASLHEMGIEIREPCHHHGRKSQPRFGERLVKGKIIEHKGEQKVIQSVVEMRGQGLSLRQIAGLLEELEVPTKGGALKWHPQMVKNILKSFLIKKNSLESMDTKN